MNSRTVRLMRRLAGETGSSLDDLLNAAREIEKQNPKLTPEQIDQMLRSTSGTNHRRVPR